MLLNYMKYKNTEIISSMHFYYELKRDKKCLERKSEMCYYLGRVEVLQHS